MDIKRAYMAISPPLRGGGNLPPGLEQKPSVRRFTMQYAWGSSPSRAMIEYTAQTAAMTLPIIPYGALIKITSDYNHLFYGIAKSDVGTMSDTGHVRVLEFEDLRAVLDWDIVYCYFNKPVKMLRNNVYKTYYENMLPNDFFRGVKTINDAPYSAQEIIKGLMGAPSVETNWAATLHVWHADQYFLRTYGTITYPYYPVLNLDFQGVTLGSAINQVCEAQGLTYIHSPTTDAPFRLEFKRLGEGPLPVYEPDGYSPSTSVGKIFPPNSNNRSFGVVDAENPARITVLGDRNLVQVHNLDMEEDWNKAWNIIWDFSDLVYLIYTRFRSTITLPGISFNSLYSAMDGEEGADNEHLIGWQLAAARAEIITVAEFASVMGFAFADYRKFNGRSRMTMPAAMYIRQVLFRAFRPPAVINIPNIIKNSIEAVPTSSLQLSQGELVRCSHDASGFTGGRIYSYNETTDGNGYAIAQGYRIGQDAFKTLQPETFNLELWNDYQAIWQHIPFQIDDNGEEGGGFILFDEPVINCMDLLGYSDIGGVDDKKIVFFKAVPTIKVPVVRASLVFATDRFAYRYPPGTSSDQIRDGVENVSGLHAEMVMISPGAYIWTEMPHADGQTATQKAQKIAVSLYKCKQVYYQGGFTRLLRETDSTIGISNMYSRVSVDISASGFKEDVEFTGDLRTNAFVPSRDFDRMRNVNLLLPGQKELMEASRQHTMIAAGLRSSPNLRNEILQLFKGEIGTQARTIDGETRFSNGGSADIIPVGTPLFKKPTTVVTLPTVPPTKKNQNTLPVLPANTAEAHTEFVGVTTRIDERGDRSIPYRRHGEILCRVKGPVTKGKAVGRSIGHAYLVMGGEPSVGTAQEEVSGTDEKIIKILTGGMGTTVESSAVPRWG